MSTNPNGAEPTSTTQHITPSQRAAVVVAMLGETAAKPIVELLDDEDVANIASSLETITFLAREQLIEIVIDFLRHLRHTSGSLRGGAGSARKVLEGVLDEPRLNLLFGIEEEDLSPTSGPNLDSFPAIWAEFARREPAKIAVYLAGLTPNIIGLVLRNVDTTLCSELICLLEEEVQTKVLGEMVNPPPQSPDIDGVIARMVKMDFLQAPTVAEADDESQLGVIGEVLSLVPGQRRQTLMGYLKSTHAEKVDQIKRGMFAVEDLPLILPRNQIPILFKALEQDFLIEVLVCFQASYVEVVEYLLSNISSRMADTYRDELSRAKPLDPTRAEQIEKDFLTKMMELKRDEIIVVQRADAPGEEA